MAKYKITFKKSVAKDLRPIPNAEIARILNRIDKLKNDPRGKGCLKLTGHDRFRIRQGICRIIYEIRDSILIINVVKIAHRSNVYKTQCEISNE